MIQMVQMRGRSCASFGTCSGTKCNAQWRTVLSTPGTQRYSFNAKQKLCPRQWALHLKCLASKSNIISMSRDDRPDWFARSGVNHTRARCDALSLLFFRVYLYIYIYISFSFFFFFFP